MSAQADRIDEELARQVSAESDGDAVKRLAALPKLEYDRIRDAEAETLGVRASTLDAEVKRARGEGETAGGTAADSGISDPKPWPKPVNGATLLNELTDTVKTHMALPPGAAEAVALWVVHAHAHDTATISPILAVTSPTPECGKTTLLLILDVLVPRGLPVSNVTAAALFRSIEKYRPTLLVDEADTYLRNSDDLRGILNSGHNRSAAWVMRTVGDNHEPRRFITWAPKAIALIGKLPATLASRSVHIELRRISAGESVTPLRGDRRDHLLPIQQRAWRWARDNAAAIRRIDPDMPPALRGRAADNWRHLIAIAELAGGAWPDRAKSAAEALNAGRSDQTAGVMLLEDIRLILGERDAERMPSQELADALVEMEDRPWPEWGRSQKPITPRQVAKMLEPFCIKPKPMRLAGYSAGTRGYSRATFEDAFARYLPKPCATPQQSMHGNDSSDFQSATRKQNVADVNGGKSPENKGCCAVADGDTETAEI